MYPFVARKSGHVEGGGWEMSRRAEKLSSEAPVLRQSD